MIIVGTTTSHHKALIFVIITYSYIFLQIILDKPGNFQQGVATPGKVKLNLKAFGDRIAFQAWQSSQNLLIKGTSVGFAFAMSCQEGLI